MNRSWLWLILLHILDLSCSAYDPFFALQKWPLKLPHWIHQIFTTPGSPPFHSPSLQSPINIRSSHAAVMKLPPLIFKDLFGDQVQLLCRNTGTTVELELPEESAWKPKLFGGPLFGAGLFEFDNLHIHWGARDLIGGEHKIDGRRYAVEGHCVHFNSKYGNITEAMKHPDGLAVVAFFGKLAEERNVCLPEHESITIPLFRTGAIARDGAVCGASSATGAGGKKDNPLMEPLIRRLPYIKYPGSSTMVSAREALAWFDQLGEPRNYFTYPGSLTTPPYTENVIWIVYPKPVNLSSRQVQAFRNILSKDYRLLRKNIRSIQAFNGRPLIYAV